MASVNVIPLGREEFVSPVQTLAADEVHVVHFLASSTGGNAYICIVDSEDNELIIGELDWDEWQTRSIRVEGPLSYVVKRPDLPNKKQAGFDVSA